MRIHVNDVMSLMGLLRAGLHTISASDRHDVSNADGVVNLTVSMSFYPTADRLLVEVGADRYEITAKRLP